MGQGAYFMIKLFYFQFDFILHVHPNTHKGVKYFSNSIYTWNKCSLRDIILEGDSGDYECSW